MLGIELYGLQNQFDFTWIEGLCFGFENVIVDDIVSDFLEQLVVLESIYLGIN